MGINLYLMLRKRDNILGSFNLRKIPKWLRWLPFFGVAGLVFMLLYCVTYLFYSRIVDLMVRFSFLSSVPVEIAGAVLMVAGSVFITIGMLELGPSARFLLPKQKTKLVTTGLYAIARNPVYLGLNSSLFGVFLLLPSLGFIIAYGFFIVTNHYRVLEEEEFLLAAFGKEYEDYTRRVGRYGPKLRPGYTNIVNKEEVETRSPQSPPRNPTREQVR